MVECGQNMECVESSSSNILGRRAGHSQSSSQIVNFVYFLGSKESPKVFGETNIFRTAFCKDYFGSDGLQD